MIYLIYEQQNLIAETDSLKFVKEVIKTRPNCAVKEVGTGKVYRPRPVRKR